MGAFLTAAKADDVLRAYNSFSTINQAALAYLLETLRQQYGASQLCGLTSEQEADLVVALAGGDTARWDKLTSMPHVNAVAQALLREKQHQLTDCE